MADATAEHQPGYGPRAGRKFMARNLRPLTMSRRDMLRTASAAMIGLAGSVLAACGPSAPSAPPPNPTAAKPAAPAQPAAAATPAGATQPGAATKPGRQLIGKLEGPSVVTDAAQLPRKFAEAPALADLVKQGKLPPFEQRLPEEPLVIQPVHEVGRYGGTWHRGFTGPGDRWNGNRTVTGPDSLLFWDYTGEKVGPNVAKGYEFQDDGRTFVLHLRKGMRWSDGEPLTADDFVFWYEDIYQNKELIPTPHILFSINGKPGKLEKVDDYTVRYVFAAPYFLFADILAGSTPMSGHAFRGGDDMMGSFAPAHYAAGGRDAVDKMARDAQFDTWPLWFKFKNDYAKNPELPTITPWKTTAPSTTPQWTLERNPYYWAVDTSGNQLPYIDKVVLSLAENLEVLNLRAIAGEYDHQERHVDLGKLPVYLENQERGNYKVYLDPGDYAGDCIIKFNRSLASDAELKKWFNDVDFRRALSLARARHIDLDGPRRLEQVQPRPRVSHHVGDIRPEEVQRYARQDRARQKGRPGFPAASGRHRAVADGGHHSRRPVCAIHADHGGDPPAVDEDRYRADCPGARAHAGRKDGRRQRDTAIRLVG